MNQYKVIGNGDPLHCFAIGEVVTFVEFASGGNSLFQCNTTRKLQQYVKMEDVELIEASLQEAEAKLKAVVAEIYQKIAEAEALADSYGLSFSLDIANGVVGDYYGDDAGWVCWNT